MGTPEEEVHTVLMIIRGIAWAQNYTTLVECAVDPNWNGTPFGNYVFFLNGLYIDEYQKFILVNSTYPSKKDLKKLDEKL